MDPGHEYYSLFKKIFAVANAKASAFERRVGNAKPQFSQLIRRALAEKKLSTAHRQPLPPCGVIPNSCCQRSRTA